MMLSIMFGRHDLIIVNGLIEHGIITVRIVKILLYQVQTVFENLSLIVLFQLKQELRIVLQNQIIRYGIRQVAILKLLQMDE